MNYLIRNLLSLILLGCICCGLAADLPDPKTGGKDGGPISILILRGHAEMNFGKQPPLDKTYQAMMKDRGYAITIASERDILSVDYLKQFNTVIYLNPSPFAGGGYFDAADWRSGPVLMTVRDNLDVLREYVKAGGGLLVVPALEELCMRTVESLQQMFRPYGLDVKCAVPRDPERKWEAAKVINAVPIYYCWTENIAKHPATGDVERIWYPSYCTRWDDNYTTIPLFPEDDSWVRLVDSMPGTQSVCRRGTIYDPRAPEIVQTGLDNPAIIAARPYGKGRIAVSGIGPFHLYYLTYDKKGHFAEANFVRIDGITMEKGDGERGSDMRVLLDNLYRWLGVNSLDEGMGGYDPETGTKPKPNPQKYTNAFYLSDRWAEDDPMITGDIRPMKILVGARSSFSSGKGSVAEWAAAAKAAGIDVLCFTETFENLDRTKWLEFVADCRANSGDEVALLPGIDYDTDLDNRFLVVGYSQRIRDHLLTDDRKKLLWTGHLFIGMGDVQPIVSRPERLTEVREKGTLTPDIYSHLASVPVATYGADGKQVDDGKFAFKILANNGTHPYPVAVHEIQAPAQLAKAAQTGMHNYVNSDTPAHAAFFFRQSHARSGGNPDRAYISGGPLVKSYKIDNWQSPNWTISLEAYGPQPITKVVVEDQRGVYREFRPAKKDVEISWSGNLARQHWFRVRMEDAAGNRAFLPVIRTLPKNHVIRCTDRQNFFAVRLPMGDVTYTGRVRAATKGPLRVSVPGVKLKAQYCPKLRFPYFGPDFIVHENAYESTLVPGGRPTGADNSPIFNELPIPEFAGTIRFTSFMKPRRGYSARQYELFITLKQDLQPTDEVWPIAASFQNRGKPLPVTATYYDPQAKAMVTKQRPDEGFIELPAGTMVNHLLLLTPMRLSASGHLGFVPGKTTAGTNYHAAVLAVPGKADAAAVISAMGFAESTPYKLELRQGALTSAAAWITLTAIDGQVVGSVTGGKMPLLGLAPVKLRGLNPRWPAGIWRPEGGLRTAGQSDHDTFIARLDVTQDGTFYAGNLLLADNPDVYLSFTTAWEIGKPVSVRVINPTNSEIKTTVSTPAAIKDLPTIKEVVTVPARGSKVITVQ